MSSTLTIDELQKKIKLLQQDIRCLKSKHGGEVRRLKQALRNLIFHALVKDGMIDDTKPYAGNLVDLEMQKIEVNCSRWN